MEKGKYGASIERGRVETAQDGRYRVQSISRDGITTMPVAALLPGETYEVGDLVYFFLFPDGDGLILRKM